MANEEQLSILKQGVDVWNRWREENPDVVISLSKADLSGVFLRRFNFQNVDLREANLQKADLIGANLSNANLTKCQLRSADLRRANISNANLRNARLTDANLEGVIFDNANLDGARLNKANLSGANLSEIHLNGANLRDANLSDANLSHARLIAASLSSANLNRANLSGANLREANLREADLSEVDLREANLTGAFFVQTNIEKARISNSLIYAINVWDIKGEFEEQKDLRINKEGEFAITVDNIKVAQFVYLILNNEEIRDVINVLTSKSVLVLGRFSIPERKMILDAIRKKLRDYNLLPIVFDFDQPTDKDFTETIKTLAGLCYFVIADVTNPKSSPLELQATVPDYQIPFVPIIQEGEKPFAMMVDLQKKYDWVLNTVSYDSQETLIKVLKPLIIDPAMKKHQELRIVKAQEPEIISAKDFLAKGKE